MAIPSRLYHQSTSSQSIPSQRIQHGVACLLSGFFNFLSVKFGRRDLNFFVELISSTLIFDFGQAQCENQRRLNRHFARASRDVLYKTSSGRRNGGDVASCCLNGPKR